MDGWTDRQRELYIRELSQWVWAVCVVAIICIKDDLIMGERGCTPFAFDIDMH